MLEVILIIGQLFVLALVILLHLLVTVQNMLLIEGNDLRDLKTIHPWFFTVEAILILTTIYLAKCMI